MKRRVKRVDYIQRIVDLILVYGSWLLAYALRFKFEVGGGTEESLLYWYSSYGLLLVLVSLIVFKNSHLYDSIRFSNINKEVATQIKANTISFVAFLVIAFFTSEHRISRIMLFFYFLFSSTFLIFSKFYFRKLMNKITHKIIMVGHGKPAIRYYENVKNYNNFEILYWVDAPKDISGIKFQDSLDYKNLEKEDVDEIVIGYDNHDAQKSSKILKELAELIVSVIILPDVSYARIGYTLSDFKGQPLIYINEPNIKQTRLIIKRMFDFTSTFIGGLVISPFIILIAALVKLTSKGPIFYSQIRMGVDGKEFKMWKFRSMVIGEANHGGWTVKDDPRVTKIGKILRKTNLDELPQLWNVLVGEMSLVGPRPERPEYVEKFRQEIPGYMIRHRFKAGVTGWAQVNGWRGDTSIVKRIEFDLWYIRNWSIWLDLSILFMTFFKGNKNAY